MNILLKRIFSVFLIVFFIFGVLILLTRSHTPNIRNDNRSGTQVGIASLEKVKLGGLDQTVLIRSQDVSLPVLLFLHGGPGMPMMFLSHSFQRPLEKHFICVQWDQRGAGKSYFKDIPVETMSVNQMMSDLYELVQHLRVRFNQDKIYLAGHSWGSYLGILFAQSYPDFLHAYVGIGQVVDEKKSLDVQRSFIRDSALRSGDQKALDELEEFGHSIHEKWLFRFGGELHNATSFWPFIKTGLVSPEYSLFDIPKIPKGSSFSSKHMRYDVIDIEIIESIESLAVPVYFFTGRFDFVTPSELVIAFLEKLEASPKEIIWFENSAHFPFYEEPEKFLDSLLYVLNQSPPAL